ncbi:ATP-binding cassette subfamily B protein [Nitrospirillum amazonense]|uniref:ATP-binding cassette subfamily B protein n=1 Tax=Nitrospirillum amazonense TaxID=28077 RepID=A0A560JLM1_9PROT|nr:ABC transporter ATP-binding protein [Nitrospirillum amazonense]TWB71857.1 ATP-binding cassette subfamily B protein [Nitrospirillum amazonense]
MDDRNSPADAGLPAFLTSPRRFIARYARRWRGHCLLLAVLVLGAASCAVAVQYGMKLLIDAMSAGAPDGGGVPVAVWRPLALFIALIGLESVLWRLTGWLGCRTTVGIGVDMRLDLFAHLSGLPMRYFTENLAGSLGQRITATAGNFGALCNTVIWRVAPPCVDFLGAVVVFSTIDWRMAAALAVFVTLVTTGLILFGQGGQPLHRAYAARAGEVAGALTDVISNMWAVKAFSARRREYDRLAASFQEEAGMQKASWMHMEKTRMFYDVVLWIMAGAMLSWVLFRWGQGAVTTGDVVIVSALTFRILHGARDLALALVDMVQHVGHIEDTLRVIGLRPTITDNPASAPFDPLAEPGAVELRQVAFAYGVSKTMQDEAGSDGTGDEDRPRVPFRAETLRDLNVHIPPGQKVAVVGPSGAGKSTLVSLLQRLYDVQDGELLISDRPVAGLRQDDLRAALAVVPQEITLFHRTILENIRFGRPGATDEEVHAAARAANCHDFILSLPEGYETLVGERGTKLSGGQRQRIGIARAFLKNSPILILDEATSALDTESELKIQRSLVELMAGRTVIAVAHRLSTVAAFDRILVMEDGRIVEDGSAADLRRRNGLFARMWRLQAEGLAAE